MPADVLVNLLNERRELASGGQGEAREELRRIYRAGTYEEGLAALRDPDLAD